MLVVIPFRGDDEARTRALRFVIDRLIDHNWPVSVGHSDGPDWCKAAAVDAGLPDGPDAEIIVVHDADVVIDQASLYRAVLEVANTQVQWAMPHRQVMRLSEPTTARFYADESLEGAQFTRPPYDGVPGGGVVVTTRGVYRDCPLDARFHGWGSEDEVWGWALTALHGEPWRGVQPLLHLWHPHAAPGARRSPRWESEQLWRAYRAYRRQPARLRALVQSGAVVGSG